MGSRGAHPNSRGLNESQYGSHQFDSRLCKWTHYDRWQQFETCSLHSKSLSEVWETPNKWVPVDSGTIGARKTVIAQKEPCKNISRQIAQKELGTRVLDSEIKLSNVIPGSPAFVRYKRITPKGKGKGTKHISIGSNPTTLDSDMA